jgi:hypothetical protein
LPSWFWKSKKVRHWRITVASREHRSYPGQSTLSPFFSPLKHSSLDEGAWPIFPLHLKVTFCLCNTKLLLFFWVYFVLVILEMESLNYLPQLASNLESPDLSLPRIFYLCPQTKLIKIRLTALIDKSLTC